MTEQLETDFWAEERAKDTAARGRQADPSACGTCRTAVAAGEQVEHDECAQRALLLPAPDAPGYELITGMSEEELAALPPRFHTPVYMESSSPQMWVCAVCWGDGWVSQWPCKTAVKHGLRVFTAEDHAETVAKKQAAELATYRALELGDLDGIVADRCDNDSHPIYLRRITDARGCGWCRTVQVITERDQAQARITELEAERKKYVGAEPTIAEEMAYLSHCLHAVYEVCDEAVRQATRWENPLPIPEWVETVRKAADGLTERTSYPPALPWAQLMDADDLADFLHELASTLVQTTLNARISGKPADLGVLAELEKVCATWRHIAEAQHAHNTAPGPDSEDPT